MRKGVTAAISAGCGVVCAVCVGLYTYDVRAEADEARAEALERYGGEQLEVCVATRDLAPGETIDESDVETQLWVADLLTDDAVCDLSDAVGQTVASTILEGEVISSRRFGEVGADLEVPDGMVAISLPAQDVQAVGGAVGAGSRVDVYATGSASTSLLASDVLVLATSTSETDSDDEVNWITVAVAPELTQSMVAASQATELYFVLPADDVADDTEVQADAQQGEAEAADGAGSDGDGADADADAAALEGEAGEEQ